jgi:hypothetical protein
MKVLEGLLLLASVIFLGGTCFDMICRSRAELQRARVVEVLCKHRLSTGYSKIWVTYKQEKYMVPVPKSSCDTIKVNSTQLLRYSPVSDQFYFDNEVQYRLLLVGVVVMVVFAWSFKLTLSSS